MKVESVPMDTESTEPTQMEVEGGSVDPVSAKDEVAVRTSRWTIAMPNLLL